MAQGQFNLPRWDEPLVDSTGHATYAWYRFLSRQFMSGGGSTPTAQMLFLTTTSIPNVFGVYSALNSSFVGTTMSGTLTKANIFIGSAGNLATPQVVSGDGTLDETGKLLVTETGGTPFGVFATGTDASQLTGTLDDARLPANVVRWVTAPVNKTDPGNPGDVAYESGFFYVCIAANSWQRTALAAW
jgi:hypothetical protein